MAEFRSRALKQAHLGATLPAAEPLDALQALDRTKLHVFVAGPGEGEGIAVALPESGWVIVDGCVSSREGKPLLAILDRWRRVDERVVAFVLTHPHEDHAKGVVELLERFPPTHIAITRPLLPRDTGSPATATALLARRVNAALAAVELTLRERGARLIDLLESATLPLGSPRVAVRVRAPHEAAVRAFFREPGVARRVREAANDISGVLEVTFGDTRVVLAGDLPRFHTGTTKRVPAGWDRVLSARPQLGQHAMLKVPHHGSEAAFHPELMTSGGRERRAWCVTPFSRCGLPSVVSMAGLPRLLDRDPQVHLTAPPLSKEVQAAAAQRGRARLSQLADRLARTPIGVPFLDNGGIEVTPRSALRPLDAVWCFACDDRNAVVGRWRGVAALEVTP